MKGKVAFDVFTIGTQVCVCYSFLLCRTILIKGG